MNPRWHKAFCWIVFTALLCACACSCEEKKKPDEKQQDLGLKVIPAGEKPARAPGPKGTMINMPDDEVRVVLVPPGSPAALAGFEAGDILLAADGKETSSEDDLTNVLEKSKAEIIFYEVRRGRTLLTQGMESRKPGWTVMSGDTFKGFLLTRIQSGRKVKPRKVGERAPALKLPTFQGKSFDLGTYRQRRVALLFWGTFSEPCYRHLQALAKACARMKKAELACVAINTMELFTAVGKTKKYQAELEKVSHTLWTDHPLPIDLFMQAEHAFGVSQLPTLILVDARGKIAERFDGPMQNPETDIPRLLRVTPASQ